MRAVAKGVRKTKSRFGGRLEPTSHVALLLYEGRELDIVSQAESVDHFRTDPRGPRPPRAGGDDARGRRPGRAGARVVAAALPDAARRAAHARGEAVGASWSPAFFWKVLDLEGLRPELDHCVTCGSDIDLVAFDVDQGGVLCRTCRRGVPISPDALALMRRILGGGLAAALDEPASPTTHEVEVLATRIARTPPRAPHPLDDRPRPRLTPALAGHATRRRAAARRCEHRGLSRARRSSRTTGRSRRCGGSDAQPRILARARGTPPRSARAKITWNGRP